MFEREVDIQLFTQLVEAEWFAFRQEYSQTPITERQDLRALLVAWLARVLPEAFNHSLTETLSDTVESWWTQPDFKRKGWHRILPLEAALFALIHDPIWLRTHRANLDHHKSSIREYLITSLAIIADQLDFDDVDLQEKTHHNLLVGHGADGCIAILMAAKGEPDRKRQVLRQWLNDEERRPIGDRQYLKDVVADRMVPNPFLGKILWVNQYLVWRLATFATREHEVQLPLPLSTDLDDQEDKPYGFGSQWSQSGEFWRRLRGHPFTREYLCLPEMSRV